MTDTPLNLLVSYCDRAELKASVNVDDGTARLEMNLSRTSVQLLFDVSDPRVLALNLLLCFGAPEARRDQVRALISRINETLRLHCFVFVDDANRILCRSAVWVGERLPDDEDFDSLLKSTAQSMEDWYPALAAVIFGGNDAESAFESQRLILEVRNAATDVS